jgi:hypothetical protein
MMPSRVSPDADGEEYLARLENNKEGPDAKDNHRGSDVDDGFDDKDSCFRTVSPALVQHAKCTLMTSTIAPKMTVVAPRHQQRLMSSNARRITSNTKTTKAKTTDPSPIVLMEALLILLQKQLPVGM